MSRLLLDTHAWVWSMTDDPRLSEIASDAMLSADEIWVSPISIFEIAQKVRKQKWPEMAPVVDQLDELLIRQGNNVAVFTPRIAKRAALLDWSNRDPFDRMLAATAIEIGVPIVSCDTDFDTLTLPAGSVARIW